MGQEIRILLIDDHSLFRESLSRLLAGEPDIRIAGSCSSVTEALAVLDREKVEVVLLDYDLGEEQGSAFFEGAKARGFSGRVLMVTAGMTDAGTLRALEGGASTETMVARDGIEPPTPAFSGLAPSKAITLIIKGQSRFIVPKTLRFLGQ